METSHVPEGRAFLFCTNSFLASLILSRQFSRKEFLLLEEILEEFSCPTARCNPPGWQLFSFTDGLFPGLLEIILILPPFFLSLCNTSYTWVWNLSKALQCQSCSCVLRIFILWCVSIVLILVEMHCIRYLLLHNKYCKIYGLKTTIKRTWGSLGFILGAG